MLKLDDKIRDEKLQYDINRKVSTYVLLLGKIDKYKYLIGEEILSAQQYRRRKDAKCSYSTLGIAFEKLVKTIEKDGKNDLKHCSL